MTMTLDSKQHEIISYHPDNLKRLQNELNKLRAEVEKRQHKIHHYTEAENALHKQIEILEEKRAVIARQIASREQQIENQIEAHNAPEKHQTSDLTTLLALPLTMATTPIMQLVEHLADKAFSSVLDELSVKIHSAVKGLGDPLLSELKEEKKELCDLRIKKCQHACELLKDAIMKENPIIADKIKRIKEISAHEAEAEHEFIPALQNHPLAMCEKFHNRILVLKKKYEDRYPEIQSDPVEICLYELEDRVKKILHIDESIEGKPDNKIYQAKYLELCGFLWRMYDSFCELRELTEIEKNLADEIFAILQDMHFSRDDDLPNEMATGKKSLVLYKSKNNDTGISTLAEVQIKKYNDAKVELETALQSSPLTTDLIRSTGDKLVKAIELQKDTDIRFSTTVLKDTKKLITPNEDTPQVFDKYLELTNKASGKPSAWKKIAGLMLGLAGAAIIGLSIYALFATGGLAAPVSLWGIKWGASLAVCAYTYLVGLPTLAFGEYAFLKGTRHGLSNNMYQYQQTVRQRKPGFFATPVASSAGEQPGGKAVAMASDTRSDELEANRRLLIASAPPPAYVS